MAKTKKRLDVPAEPTTSPETPDTSIVEPDPAQHRDLADAVEAAREPLGDEPQADNGAQQDEPAPSDPITVMTSDALGATRTPGEILMEQVGELRAGVHYVYGIHLSVAVERYTLAQVAPACEALALLSRSLMIVATDNIEKPVELDGVWLTLTEVVSLLSSQGHTEASDALVNALSRHKPGKIGRAIIFGMLQVQLATMEATALHILETEREAAEQD